jgi:hypothetical protein
MAFDHNSYHCGKEGRRDFLLRGFGQLWRIDEKGLAIGVGDRPGDDGSPRMMNRLKQDLKKSKLAWL